MAQLFHLEIADGTDTAVFYSTSQSGNRLQLADGGFQVGLPKTKRNFGVLRPGVGIMTQEERDAREATIKFSVYASSRSGLISQIAKINNILKRVSQRARTGAGERVDLKYAWEGAGKATYLEVYGGELQLPDNLWSVEGMHAEIYGEYVIPNLELKLWLSPEAYSISLRSTSMTQVPLSNSYGSGNTSGLKIVNTGTNYVEISGNSIDGDTPVPVKISVDPGTVFSRFYYLYIGLQRELDGYPTNLLYDSGNCEPLYKYGNTYGGGYGGNYQAWTRGGAANSAPFGWSWEYNNTKGTFYTLMHHGNSMGQEANSISCAISYSDFATYGIVRQGDWFKLHPSRSASPLGVLDLPPGPPELANKGTFHEDLWLTIAVANSIATTINMDYLRFLPIQDGLRIWHARMTTGGGTAIDDGWEGLEYLDGGSKIWTPFYGTLNPIKLVPGENQRLYFAQVTGNYDQNNELKIQVDYVPTYQTMVE